MSMQIIPQQLEEYRIRHGHMRSGTGSNFGAFVMPGPCGMQLYIIATPGSPQPDIPDADKWEHVSVSGRRIPNWEEMCFVRKLFWGEDDWVVQFHPPRTEYVNNFSACLHLWRYKGSFPTPPAILVGIKGLEIRTPAERGQS